MKKSIALIIIIIIQRKGNEAKSLKNEVSFEKRTRILAFQTYTHTHIAKNNPRQ